MSSETQKIREVLTKCITVGVQPGVAESYKALEALDQLEQRSTALGRIVGHKPGQQWIPVSEHDGSKHGLCPVLVTRRGSDKLVHRLGFYNVNSACWDYNPTSILDDRVTHFSAELPELPKEAE